MHRPGRLDASRVAVLVAVAWVLLTACSSGGPPAASAPKVPNFATSTARTSAAISGLPRTCDSVAAAADVDQIVGHQLPGGTNGIVGIAEPAIGRTGRLDCYYGLPAGQPMNAAAVSIGLAQYTDPQSAQHRVQMTVTSARNAGANTSSMRVGSDNAVLVAAQQNQELVFAHADLTVLVSALNGVLPQGRIGPTLAALAQRALSGRS